MIKRFFLLAIITSLFQLFVLASEPFQFALLTDLHISALKPQHAQDLQLAVKEINENKSIEFVLVSGDDSDLGDLESLLAAKKMLDALKVPYYITSGNHDTHQGSEGSVNFLKAFTKDQFSFQSHGFQFVGFPTGPAQSGGLGLIAEKDLKFVQKELSLVAAQKPLFLITHYPLLEGDVSNRKDLLNIAQKYNVIAFLCGHYHRNVLLNFEGIPGIVNRSVLRAKEPVGGYSIYTVSDSLKVSEKHIGQQPEQWLALPLAK